ncbi:MAG: hypothetical protein IJM19_09305 [Ruminococcus sp.]|nr:hypothetical protein [Ruminococcus sp.]MBR6385773.1 hypothetical protein [Ruminococcus sp.]
MAVKRNKKTKGNVKDNNSRKKGLFNRKLVIVAAASSVVVSAVLFVTTYKDCRVKDAEARLIEEQIKSYEKENEELQKILDSDDISEYMEKVALEKYGYAYPDERRFYETSRD